MKLDRKPVATPAVAVPGTLEEALDPTWLSQALAPISGGARIASVEVVDLLKTMASKVRIKVRFEGEDRERAYCLKSFLDNNGGSGSVTDVIEAGFYIEIAPRITMRTPEVVAAIIDREQSLGLLVMTDMIAAGIHFCSALEPLGPDQTVQSLEQIARLHTASHLLDELPWIPYRAATFMDSFPEAMVHGHLRDPRGETLTEETKDAARLFRAMRALRDRDAGGPMTLLHGDCHAGNLYWAKEGPGFTDWQTLQRGSWARDVAYHIVTTLPVEIAEREERRLLHHYLDTVAALGGTPPDRETAWEEYRAAQVYGFFMWAITRFTDPAIIRVFIERLGAGVERHDAYGLLAV